MVQSVDRNGNIRVTNVFGLNILGVIARHCCDFCFVFFIQGVDCWIRMYFLNARASMDRAKKTK